MKSYTYPTVRVCTLRIKINDHLEQMTRAKIDLKRRWRLIQKTLKPEMHLAIWKIETLNLGQSETKELKKKQKSIHKCYAISLSWLKKRYHWKDFILFELEFMNFIFFLNWPKTTKRAVPKVLRCDGDTGPLAKMIHGKWWWWWWCDKIEKSTSNVRSLSRNVELGKTWLDKFDFQMNCNSSGKEFRSEFAFDRIIRNRFGRTLQVSKKSWKVVWSWKKDKEMNWLESPGRKTMKWIAKRQMNESDARTKTENGRGRTRLIEQMRRTKRRVSLKFNEGDSGSKNESNNLQRCATFFWVYLIELKVRRKRKRRENTFRLFFLHLTRDAIQKRRSGKKEQAIIEKEAKCWKAENDSFEMEIRSKRNQTAETRIMRMNKLSERRRCRR